MSAPVLAGQVSRGAGLVRGDALAIPLGDATVDLVVTSPPYFALRSYRDGGEHYDGQLGSEPTPALFLEALWAVMSECWRVLKPGGSVFVNLGDKYAGSGGHNNATLTGPSPKSTLSGSKRNRSGTEGAVSRRQAPDKYNQASDGIRAKSLMGLPWRFAIGCIDGQADPDGRGWILRSEIVWSKPNGLPESVKDRVRRSHEQWFHFTKEGTYYSQMDGVREPYNPAAHNSPPDSPVWGDASYPTWGLNGSQSVSTGGIGTRTPPDPRGKLPNSVWTIPTQPLTVPAHLEVDHFAAFPTEWPRRIILGWSPPGGVILDPFGGTGTTAMVARALGRFGVSMDLSADYQRLAKWRIWESGQAAKVAAKTDGERQTELFG